MITNMQFGAFTHAKCFNCGHVGKIEAFPMEKTELQKSEGVESYIAAYSCPVCTAQNCEPLFPNEVN